MSFCYITTCHNCQLSTTKTNQNTLILYNLYPNRFSQSFRQSGQAKPRQSEKMILLLDSWIQPILKCNQNSPIHQVSKNSTKWAKSLTNSSNLAHTLIHTYFNLIVFFIKLAKNKHSPVFTTVKRWNQSFHAKLLNVAPQIICQW